MFVDSHAHLDGRQFDTDRQQVIDRALEAGLQTIVAIGNGDGPTDVDCGKLSSKSALSCLSLLGGSTARIAVTWGAANDVPEW